MRSRLLLLAAAADAAGWAFLTHYTDTLAAKALWEWMERADLAGWQAAFSTNFTRLQARYNDKFYVVPTDAALAQDVSDRLALVDQKITASIAQLPAGDADEDLWRLMEALLRGPVIHPFPPQTARGLKIEMKQICAGLLASGNATYAREVLSALVDPAALVAYARLEEHTHFDDDELVDAVWRKQLNPVIRRLADENDDQALRNYLADYLYSAQKLPVDDLFVDDLQEGFKLNAFEGQGLDLYLLKDLDEHNATTTTSSTGTPRPKVRGTPRRVAEQATTGFIHGYETFECEHNCEGLDYGAVKARSNDHGYQYLQEVSVVAPGIHVGADIDYNVLTGAGMWQSTIMYGTRPEAVGEPFCLGISEADWQWVNTKFENRTYPTVLLSAQRGPEWIDRYTPVAIWSALRSMGTMDTPTHVFVAPGYAGEFNPDAEHEYPANPFEMAGRRCLETIDNNPAQWLISRRDYHEALAPLTAKVPLISLWFGLVQNRTNITQLGTPYVDHLKGHGIDLRVTWTNDTADTDWYDAAGNLVAHGMEQQ